MFIANNAVYSIIVHIGHEVCVYIPAQCALYLHATFCGVQMQDWLYTVLRAGGGFEH